MSTIKTFTIIMFAVIVLAATRHLDDKLFNLLLLFIYGGTYGWLLAVYLWGPRNDGTYTKYRRRPWDV